jgi:hypothetical protein
MVFCYRNYIVVPVIKVFTSLYCSERALLNRLMIELYKLDSDVLVGHNISGFDLDVLLHRAQVGTFRQSFFTKTFKHIHNIFHCFNNFFGNPFLNEKDACCIFNNQMNPTTGQMQFLKSQCDTIYLRQRLFTVQLIKKNQFAVQVKIREFTSQRKKGRSNYPKYNFLLLYASNVNIGFIPKMSIYPSFIII